MATKKKPSEEAAVPEESTLVSTAKAIGAAAGKIAHMAGVKPEAPATKKKVKIPKLAPKNKARLPRREKKELKKKNAAK